MLAETVVIQHKLQLEVKSFSKTWYSPEEYKIHLVSPVKIESSSKTVALSKRVENSFGISLGDRVRRWYSSREYENQLVSSLKTESSSRTVAPIKRVQIH